MEARLKANTYAGLGEFHAYGADADTPVMQRMIELAKERRIFLHAHSDADAVERMFKHNPEALVLWAHSGFEQVDKVRDMVTRHKTLWADVAHRNDQAPSGKLDPTWRQLFVDFPERFMVGTDTYTPERWHYVVEHAGLLAQVAGRAAAGAGRQHRLPQRRAPRRPDAGAMSAASGAA